VVGATVARAGGATGGVSVGAYTGMIVGGVIGIIAGAGVADFAQDIALIRSTIFLDALAQGYFQASMLGLFLISVLGTAVGAIVGGINKRHPSYP